MNQQCLLSGTKYKMVLSLGPTDICNKKRSINMRFKALQITCTLH